MNIKLIPLNSLIITVGSSVKNNEKILSTWFSDYEIISVEDMRYKLSGDYNRLDIDKIVFSEIHRLVETKLKLGERIVVNVSNLRNSGRTSLGNIAISCGVPVFYLICFNESNVELQQSFLSSEKEILKGDGIAEVIDLRTCEIDSVKKVTNITNISDKFRGITVVGDVHGMYQALLAAIDWAKSRRHFIIFMGDIIDYGSGTLECADEVYRTVMRGNGELILGNHERKIAKWIDQTDKNRFNMKLSDGNKVTTQALSKLSHPQKTQWMTRFRALVHRSPLMLNFDNFVFTHAAVHPSRWIEPNRKDMEIYSLFGEFEGGPTSKKPKRTYEWINAIPQDITVFIGHDARSNICPLTVNNDQGGSAVFLDTGSGKGGFLSSVDLRFTDKGPKIENFNRH